MKTGLLLGVLALGTILAAELSGRRAPVYGGATGGLALALVGAAFAARMVRAHHAGGGWDVWALWGAGFLARLALLGVLAWFFWRTWEAQAAAAMIALAAVYLAGLFWETAWLYRRLIPSDPGGETKDG